MKNALIVIVLILIILGVGGGFYFLNQGKSTPSSDTALTKNENIPDSTENKEETGTVETFQGTVMDLMKKTIPQKCQATITGEEVESNGTYYISPSDKKIRMDVTTTLEEEGKDKTIQAHMIMDEQFVYNWMDGQTIGMKISAEAGKEAAANDQANAQVAEQLKQQVSFSCMPWIIVPSMFELPKNVSFSDMSKGVEDMMNNKDIQDMIKKQMESQAGTQAEE